MDDPTTPDWTFRGTWPFEPRFFDTPDGVLHYVDEGPGGGTGVVLLHGNPTWSYMYRRLIAALRERTRVVAVDLLGFGRSAKPAEVSAYALAAHVERVAALLDHAGLAQYSLVVHDWGGPVGLGVAARHPDRLRGLIALNTFAPVLPGPLGGGLDMRLLRRMIRLPTVAERVYQRQNAMVERFLLGKGTATAATLDEAVREAYRAPHPDPAARAGIAAFPLQIPRSAGDEAAVQSAAAYERLRARLEATPVLLLWGTRDPLFPAATLDEWQRAAPHARVERLAQASHYVMEDAPDSVCRAVERFLAV